VSRNTVCKRREIKNGVVFFSRYYELRLIIASKVKRIEQEDIVSLLWHLSYGRERGGRKPIEHVKSSLEKNCYKEKWKM